MRLFLKNMLSSFVGTLLAIGVCAISSLVLIGLIVSLFSDDANSQQEVKKGNFLKIELEQEIVEFAENHPLSKLDIAGEFFPVKTGVFQIKQALDKAASDDKIRGVYLKLDMYSGGLGQAEEIRQQLLEFKNRSNKPVIVYGNSFNESSYYIATIADYIGLNPMGSLEFNGLRAEILYFTGLFEKLGVDVNIFKAGKYKSAVEPFFKKEMSEANREQLTAFLGGIQETLFDSTAGARDVPLNQVELISKEMLIRSPKDAARYKFVDVIDYETEFLHAYKSSKDLVNKLVFVDYTTYNNVHQEDLNINEDKIAVLFSEGEIIYGKSVQNKQIGHLSVVKQLKKLTKDSTVKAIVLRINSPGGSGYASDLMWKQLQETRKHKPVIASMSDYAASGGYYMAMACDEIVAHPMTITGSIGVFGMFPTFGELMEDKLGITSDRVKTGTYSDLYSISRKMTESEKDIVQTQVDQFYSVFVQKVADSRQKSFAQIDNIASGRVWNGVQAKKNGLVDYLGGLNQAISIAEEKSGVEDYQLVSYQKIVKEDVESILGGGDQESVQLKKPELYQGEIVQQYLKLLEKVNTCKGVQTRIPFEMNIK